MYQCFHPISTTGLGPFLLLMILNFRIYRRLDKKDEGDKNNKSLLTISCLVSGFSLSASQLRSGKMFRWRESYWLWSSCSSYSTCPDSSWEYSRSPGVKSAQLWPGQGWTKANADCVDSEWLFTVFSPRPPTPCPSGRWWWTRSPGTWSSSTAASTSSSTAWLATSSDRSSSQHSPQKSPPSFRSDDWINS